MQALEGARCTRQFSRGPLWLSLARWLPLARPVERGATMITTNPLGHQASPHRTIPAISVEQYDSDTSELLSVLRCGRPNLLIIGSAIQNERVLDQMQAMLRAPVARWSPLEQAAIPEAAFGTLVVRHVQCLTAGQQASFASWLRRVHDLQIISFAGMPVFPLVTAGTFLEELYYRLNVFLLEPGRTATGTLEES